MAGWFVRDFGKKVRDNTKTFCANPEFKAQKGNWHQKSPITNVTLLHFLNFIALVSGGNLIIYGGKIVQTKYR